MEVKKIAVFPGSFDPITIGHLDILKRSLKDFDEVIVLVAINPDKRYHYSLKERIKMIKIATKNLKHVKVDSTKGLTVNYAKKHHAKYLVRGVRNQEDALYEKKMSDTNKRLNKNIETIIYKANKKLNKISSSEVINKLKKGEEVSPYLPKGIKL